MNKWYRLIGADTDWWYRNFAWEANILRGMRKVCMVCKNICTMDKRLSHAKFLLPMRNFCIISQFKPHSVGIILRQSTSSPSSLSHPQAVSIILKQSGVWWAGLSVSNQLTYMFITSRQHPTRFLTVVLNRHFLCCFHTHVPGFNNAPRANGSTKGR